MGEGVRLINVSEAATLQMKDYLEEHKMTSGLDKGEYEFYASDSIDQFRTFSEQILDLREVAVSKINIEKY